MERAFPLEVKAVDDSGSFTGLASTYGNVDHGGDVIEHGAFTATLQRTKERPILWAHDTTAPIGLGVLEDSALGLQIDGQLDLDVQAGRDAYSRLCKRIVRGLSIGYRSLKDTVKDGVRHLQALELYEVSLVVLPMNPAAVVTRVKSQLTSVRDYEHWLRQAGGFSKSEAKRLAAHGWPVDDDEDQDDGDEAEDLLAWLRNQKAAQAPVSR